MAPSETAGSGVPPTLHNDAYSYYGLEDGKPKVYDLTVTGPKSSQTTQTISISFRKMDGEFAIYDEKDSGQLMGESSVSLRLEPSGLFVEAISPQTLKTPHFMQLPGNLVKGKVWSNHQQLESNGQTVDEKLQFKVRGDQSVSTSAGKFTALDIFATGDAKFAGSPATMTEETWYVKDVGIVKQVVVITTGGVRTTMVESLRK